MSHILSHLESKGLIKRILNPQDARQFFIQLRPEGKRRAIELIKFFDRLQSRFEKKQGTADFEREGEQLNGQKEQ
jgi:DNA-binding MarR family transcriptional regulator